MEVSAEFHGLILNSRGTRSDNELREVQEFVEGRDFNLALETLCVKAIVIDPYGDQAMSTITFLSSV